MFSAITGYLILEPERPLKAESGSSSGAALWLRITCGSWVVPMFDAIRCSNFSSAHCL
jgi:hypothetical protein